MRKVLIGWQIVSTVQRMKSLIASSPWAALSGQASLPRNSSKAFPCAMQRGRECLAGCRDRRFRAAAHEWSCLPSSGRRAHNRPNLRRQLHNQTWLYSSPWVKGRAYTPVNYAVLSSSSSQRRDSGTSLTMFLRNEHIELAADIFPHSAKHSKPLSLIS